MVTKEEYERITKLVEDIVNGIDDEEPEEFEKISDDDNIQGFYERWARGHLTDQEWIQLRNEVEEYIKNKKDVDEKGLSEFMESLVMICDGIEGYEG